MIAILGAGDFGLAMGHAIGRTGQKRATSRRWQRLSMPSRKSTA